MNLVALEYIVYNAQLCISACCVTNVCDIYFFSSACRVWSYILLRGVDMRSSRGGLVGRGCAGNSLIPSSNHEYERIILYFRSSRKVSFFPYRIFCGIFSLNIINGRRGRRRIFKKNNVTPTVWWWLVVNQICSKMND